MFFGAVFGVGRREERKGRFSPGGGFDPSDDATYSSQFFVARNARSDAGHRLIPARLAPTDARGDI